MDNKNHSEIKNFSKEINDYYNLSIVISDGKTIAILGANFILLNTIFENIKSSEKYTILIASIFSFFSILICCNILFLFSFFQVSIVWV